VQGCTVGAGRALPLQPATNGDTKNKQIFVLKNLCSVFVPCSLLFVLKQNQSGVACEWGCIKSIFNRKVRKEIAKDAKW
jgi:hypothetical protein